MLCGSDHYAAHNFVNHQYGVERIAIGEKLWLFRKENGACNQLLIWTHGVKTWISSQFAARQTIVWLCPHGAILESVPIAQNLDANETRYDSISSQNTLVYNYNLTKMPGHQPLLNENYDDIQRAIRDRTLAMDVLVVRNRLTKTGIDLQETLNTLRQNLLDAYPIIVLCSCRGGHFTPSDSRATRHVAKNNPLLITDIPGYSPVNL